MRCIDSPDGLFHPTTIERREPGPNEVLFDVLFAGICHSDIHTARSEWGQAHYPLVPGHELAGIVTQVGENVTGFQVGDHVGVGCFVDSCRECESCLAGKEQFCTGAGRTIWTYNTLDHYGKYTDGGYSTAITVDEKYLLHIPDSLPLDAAAPLLCAGITTYSPLRKWGAGPGKQVAIVGMGGLGHVAVKIAVALGAEVSVISQTRSKEDDGRRFGAVDYIATSEPGALKRVAGKFDLVLSTVAAEEDITPLVATCKRGGVFVDVGMPAGKSQLSLKALCGIQAIVAASMIGGIPETQEMLDFCGEHGITAQVEVISGDQISAAYDNVVKSRVRYRYVIDTSTFPEV
ncbi:MAG: NAD(P)-dependent alcohol dehydrogenase [Propionibacteriaceae bacterium]|nr:NAD(P)-dependent alcohol dehydrogenase [Propionibacteriaceae bacterium]